MPSYNSFSINKLKGMKSNLNTFKFNHLDKEDKRKLFLISSVLLFLVLSTIFWLVVPSLTTPQRAQGKSISSSSFIINENINNNEKSEEKEYSYIDLNNFTGFTINQINSSQSATSSSIITAVDQTSKSNANTVAIHKIKTRQILSLKIPIKVESDKENLFLEFQVNKELQIVGSTMQFTQGDKIQNIPVTSINNQAGIASIIPNQLENGLGSLKKDTPAELSLDIYIPDKTSEGIYVADLIETQIDLASGKGINSSLYKANLIVSSENTSAISQATQNVQNVQSVVTSIASSTDLEDQ